MEIENHKEEVPFAHYEDLFRSLNPVEAAERTGAKWDGKEFYVNLLGREYAIAHPEYILRPLDGGALPPLPVQTFLLRYLLESKAVAWAGQWKTFREMPWGEMYIKPYTGRVLTRAAFTFGVRIDAFRAAAEKMGATPVPHGDAGYQFNLIGGYQMLDEAEEMIATGKADMALAGMTVKPDRLENADFSEPYWVAVQTILVPEENTDVVDVESLRGKKIGVVTGYTGDSALVDMGFESDLHRYTKGVDAVMDLKAGNLDAVVIDSPTANRFIEKFGGIKGINDEAAFEQEEYAVGVKKGNTELLEKINATIKRLKENGDIDRFAEEIDARLGE